MFEYMFDIFGTKRFSRFLDLFVEKVGKEASDKFYDAFFSIPEEDRTRALHWLYEEYIERKRKTAPLYVADPYKWWEEQEVDASVLEGMIRARADCGLEPY